MRTIKKAAIGLVAAAALFVGGGAVAHAYYPLAAPHYFRVTEVQHYSGTDDFYIKVSTTGSHFNRWHCVNPTHSFTSAPSYFREDWISNGMCKADQAG